MKLRELKKGDTGFDVVALQEALKEHADTYPLIVDGIFNDDVEEVVKEFNKAYLYEDSVVCSYRTWFELLISPESSVIIRALFEMLKVCEEEK